MIDGQRQKLSAEEVEKGQIGKISKGDRMEESNFKAPKEGILKYFNPVIKQNLRTTQTDISESVDDNTHVTQLND